MELAQNKIQCVSYIAVTADVFRLVTPEAKR
jgi:hypothetical protein